MNKTKILHLIMILLLSLLISCESNTKTNIKNINTETLSLTRNSVEQEYKTIDFHTVKIEQSDEDVLTVLNISQTLLSTEKELSNIKNIELNINSDMVIDGRFLFSINSTESKTLVFEIFDEEGYTLRGTNNFQINKGSNYNAINFNTFENGTYIFRLKDKYGGEINNKIEIYQD